MYCPRCAAQNLDDAKFCRACGADIRLVPQALQGTLPAASARPNEAATRDKKKPRPPATEDEALKSLFTGFALFIIFLIGIFVFRGAFWVTIWFIIPALSNVGEGIGQLIRARQERAYLTEMPPSEVGNFRTAPFAPVVRELSTPDTAEIIHAPASVTDVTTRHLDAPSKAR
ncbi:MAG TPA: zinc ribbon domain-containing protein [Pyrinomonadaceae bacterium]|nr:zinc ribbon domain-containing protein [Pyrinomonadaceae bacterium]